MNGLLTICDSARRGRSAAVYLVQVACLAALYFTGAQLGLLLAVPPGYTTAISPAAGIALAALLFFGYRLWPGILLGALLVHLWTPSATQGGTAISQSVGTAISLGLGASLQGVLGAWLIRRFVGFPTPLVHTGEVSRFFLLAGPAGCLTSATWGVATVWAAGLAAPGDHLQSWLVWWVGDAIGVLIVVPLVVVIAGIPPSAWRGRKLPVALPVVIIFVAVVALYFYASQREQNRITLEYDRQAAVVGDALDKSLNQYLEVLKAIGSLYASTEAVSRKGFRRYVERTLSRVPGIQALSWNPRIYLEERAAWEEAGRLDGYPRFQFTERDGQGNLVRAGPRQEYIAVLYIEPYKGNENALGYDVGSNPTRRAALDVARDTGQPVATARITLVQETATQAGILVFLPIYRGGRIPSEVAERRRRLLGYATAVLRVGDVLDSAIGGIGGRDIVARLRDDTAGGDEGPLAVYRFPHTGQPSTYVPLMRAPLRSGPTWSGRYTVGGRKWTLTLAATPQYVASRRSAAPWLIMVAGLLATSLLAAFQLLLSGRATELTRVNDELRQENHGHEQALKALEESETRFRALVEHAPEAIVVLDADRGRFVDFNNNALRLFGLEPADVKNTGFLDVSPPCQADGQPSAMLAEKYIRKALDGGVPAFEWILCSAKGCTIACEVRLVRLAAAGRNLVRASITDITGRKRAEEKLRETMQQQDAILQNIPDIAWLKDRESRYIAVNESFAKAAGTSPNRVIGKTDFDLWPVELARKYRNDDASVIETKQTVRLEERVVTGDGREGWVDTFKTPILNHAGEVIGTTGIARDITQRKRTESALRESEEKFRQMAESIREVFYIVELAEPRLLYVSPGYETVWGRSTESLYENPLSFLDAVHSDDQPRVEKSLRKRAAGEPTEEIYRIIRTDGTTRWIWDRANPLRNESGRTYRVAGLAEDITERKHWEEVLYEQKERAQVTLASIGDGVITTDAHGRVEYLNPVAEKLTGWETKKARGRTLARVFHIVNENTRARIPDPVARCLNKSEVVALADQTLLVNRSGKEYAVQTSAAPILARNKDVLGVVLVFNDVTEAHRLAQEVSHRAAHDALTGLVNRREFEARLERALHSAKDHDVTHALCYLDLDQFKLVNDTAGHAAGDELLRQVAQLFMQKVRGRDTLARIGGDEFSLILENCPSQTAQEIAESLSAALQDFRFIWKGQTFRIGVSIGLTSITADARTIGQLLTEADVACYAAKDLGRNRVAVYEPQDSEPKRRHMEILRATELREALQADRFRLYCQPIVSLSQVKPEPSCYEILLRLLNPDGSISNPTSFMRAAERYGLMPDIDRWVIESALMWYGQGESSRSPGSGIAINLSGSSLNDGDLLDFILRSLESVSVPKQSICFEITETAAIENLGDAKHFICTLKQAGCRFALDDFGTGLCSFGYLKQLAVDYLKIDGAFVRNIASDAADRAMVAAINELAHTMGMHTIAEWVEDTETLMMLRTVGVDFVQGRTTGRPMPLEELDHGLEAPAPRAST